MTTPTQETTEKAEKPKHQMVLYDVCERDFEVSNLYGMGGVRPNARHIAHTYGCELEFRESQYRNTHPNTTWFNLDRFGIGRDGSCLSAVLVGEDREQLAKARADIHRTHGVAPFDQGDIDISDRKSFFG